MDLKLGSVGQTRWVSHERAAHKITPFLPHAAAWKVRRLGDARPLPPGWEQPPPGVYYATHHDAHRANVICRQVTEPAYTIVSPYRMVGVEGGSGRPGVPQA
eukprot:TRINITY_DN13039_c0_g1_i1.p2 TRINITY_DN13039_c0_g1~~TRINITY_DN13039_c0_g1_i1.p2  ORF type:complete len:102 (-),score=8.22 TRINITY_DN13039_c0_g1_i1:35-340(-)